MGFFVGMSSLAVLIFVPESPQWKRAKERRASSRLADLFTPRYRRSTVVGSLLSTTALLGVWGSFLWLPAYVDQITEGTPMEGKAKTIVSLWSAGGQIVGAFLGGLIAGWMGNRRSWRVLCAASWLSVYILLSTSDRFEMKMAWMAGGAALFVTSFFGWLPKFLPELYPTRIRATGQGFAYNIGRVLTGFGALATGFIVSLFDGDFRSGMIAMATIYLLGIFVVSFAPDTGGRLLSDEEDEAPGPAPRGKGTDGAVVSDAG
jgi:SHS family sialic acid transporter-like MFS transporter